MLSSPARLLALGAACVSLFSSRALALDCPRGGVSNTTAVRKTYPVPAIAIYPLVGDFFNTKWSTLYSFNYTGKTHPALPANASSSDDTPPPVPNATRVIVWGGFEFKERLIFINDTDPARFFDLRWNLTNPPVSKDYVPLIIDAYIQDFKFTSSCDDEAALLEWTVEYCANDQAAGWDLFQNTTLLQADNLAMALNVSGAANGTWDVGCAIPTSTSASSTSAATGTSTDGFSVTTTGARRTSTGSPNAAMAMATAAPYGGALALLMAAAVVL
ncbi:hypothetical protein Dda_1687 [Drechslerella dactyloides]|uniref:Uncharacterized protein n=1 Tax=Drechslerella dactyloides TaxID=74499 RepID=A0AAD6J6J1_DREDA|nr:hypothetical protein Dda_1687 [Drechslerella dactyloides]